MNYVNVLLGSYKELHDWSVNNYAEFWEECFHFFDILHSTPHSQVRNICIQLYITISAEIM